MRLVQRQQRATRSEREQWEQPFPAPGAETSDVDTADIDALLCEVDGGGE